MPRASLSQTITQKTVLSQQLRQSVELLQLSGPELQRELEVQLLSNPLLKLDEEPESEDVTSKADDVGYLPTLEACVAHEFREPYYLTWRITTPDIEEYDPYGNIGSQETLFDYLMHQAVLFEGLLFVLPYLTQNLTYKTFLLFYITIKTKRVK